MTECQALHETIAASGTVIAQKPFKGPFGTTFVFHDVDCYVATEHEWAARPVIRELVDAR